MKDIWLSTTNEHKKQEFRTLLRPFHITLHTPNELSGFADVEETGATFAENAMLKAQVLYDIVRQPVIADDSGLIVAALNGAPGIYSARYAGLNATDADNRALLLHNMKDIKTRTARFVCALAFIQNDDASELFEGEVEGQICEKEHGFAGFGYDRLFFSDELGKTFAEATVDERHKVSHRARAFNKFLERLTEITSERSSL